MADFERTISAAQGYAELGMYPEALRELEALEPEIQEGSDVLELRLAILLQAKKWPAALATARKLCRVSPGKPSGHIHAAFCLHELGRTVDARAALLAGPATLMDEPSYHYNLACYECVLGNREAAEAHLETSFQMDDKYRAFARTDPDLQGLRDQ